MKKLMQIRYKKASGTEMHKGLVGHYNIAFYVLFPIYMLKTVYHERFNDFFFVKGFYISR